jgi:G3E family GTPase
MITPRVPTTLITGALGVGKTTAILDLAQHRPPDRQWVVLVNEFGEVGIDGAILGDVGGLAVEELPGGCLCCTGSGPMGPRIRTVLDQLKPDRLIVEPTGIADAGRLIDLLTGRFGDDLQLQATIGLVDPRALSRPRGRDRDAWRSQVDAADVLVGNRIDRCEDDEIRDFLAWGEALWPPKRAVVTTVGGALDPTWLTWEAQAPSAQAHSGGPHDHPHAHPHAVGALEAPAWVDQTGVLPAELGRRLFRQAWSGPDFRTCGWRFPAESVFDNDRLEGILAALMTDSALVPAGALRVKGVFRTQRGWFVAQVDADGVRMQATGWRRDSRLEVIARADRDVDWVGVDAALIGCVQAD